MQDDVIVTIEFHEEIKFVPGQLTLTVQSAIYKSIRVKSGTVVKLRSPNDERNAIVAMCEVCYFSGALRSLEALDVDVKEVAKKCAKHDGLVSPNQLCVLWAVVPLVDKKELKERE
jgi:hypothetical protein